jgi:hypothetical protein
LIDDLDFPGVGTFLAAHHVPIVSPEICTRLIAVIERIEVVGTIYPFPATVDAYRLALQLVLLVAAEHQQEFCKRLEAALEE